MEQSGKVSVILPLYNGEQYIEKAINSVLRSEYENIELIVIDDGSTDKGPMICDRLRQTDNRIVLYRKENGGVASARNYGVSVAAGAYLCFCDQDDIVDSKCYADQIRRLESDQSDICMCSVARSIDGKRSAFEVSDDACYEGEEILEQLLYPLIFNGYDVPVRMGEKRRYPQIWSCMFRRRFWQEHGFWFRSYVNFEDDMLVKVQALAAAKRVSTLSRTGYYWRTNLSSASYRHRSVKNIAVRQQRCYEDLYQSIADRIGDQKVLEWFRKVTYCRQYLEAVHDIAASKERKSRKAIYDYYDRNIYSRCFTECIDAAKYVKKDVVRPRILLWLLARRQTMMSYHADRVLDRVRRMTLRSHGATQMERMLKGVGFRR